MLYFLQLWDHKLSVHVINFHLQVVNQDIMLLQVKRRDNTHKTNVSITLTSCWMSKAAPNALQDLSYSSTRRLSSACLSMAERSGSGSMLSSVVTMWGLCDRWSPASYYHKGSAELWFIPPARPPARTLLITVLAVLLRPDKDSRSLEESCFGLTILTIVDLIKIIYLYGSRQKYAFLLSDILDLGLFYHRKR